MFTVVLGGVKRLVTRASDIKQMLVSNSRTVVMLLFDRNTPQSFYDLFTYLKISPWTQELSATNPCSTTLRGSPEILRTDLSSQSDLIDTSEGLKQLEYEISTISKEFDQVKKQNKELRLRNTSLLQQVSKSTRSLSLLRSQLPLSARKHLVTIIELDKTNPKREERLSIVFTLLEALSTNRYHPDIFNYKFCHTQFKYATLNNVRGMASHKACHPDVFCFWMQFVADFGKSPYKFLSGNGFRIEIDENSDGSDDESYSKPLQISQAGENSGALWGPHFRTYGKHIQREKQNNNTFGLNKKKLDTIAALGKLNARKVRELGGELEFGHQTDETDMGLDDVTVSIVDKRLVVFGLPNYGGLEEASDFPFNLLPGVAKSLNQLERILNDHRTRLRFIKDELQPNNIFDVEGLVGKILALFRDTNNVLTALQPLINDSVAGVEKSQIAAQKRQQKKVMKQPTSIELHGNAIAAMERKQVRLLHLRSFETAYSQLRIQVTSITSALKLHPPDVTYVKPLSFEIIKVLSESVELVLETSLALAPRGTKLQAHLISDSYHFGSYIAFSFISASVTAELSRYIDDLLYNEFAKRGIYLAWKAADGLTISHTMYKGYSRPTVAAQVYAEAILKFDAKISVLRENESASNITASIKLERKVEYVKENFANILHILSGVYWSKSTHCWFQVPAFPHSLIHWKQQITPEMPELERMKKRVWKQQMLILIKTTLSDESFDIYVAAERSNADFDTIQLKTKDRKPVWSKFFHHAILIQAAAEHKYLSEPELNEWCYFFAFVLELHSIREKEPGVDFFKTFYIPEIRNGKPYYSIYDWPHFHKNFTTTVSENGFMDIVSSSQIMELFESKSTLLTINFLDRDKQNVYDAKYFWSADVELKWDKYPDVSYFWKLVREADEAFDNKGLSDNERINRQQSFLDFLKSKLLPSLYMNPPSTHCPSLSFSQRSMNKERRPVINGAIPWDQAVKSMCSIHAVIALKKDVQAKINFNRVILQLNNLFTDLLPKSADNDETTETAENTKTTKIPETVLCPKLIADAMNEYANVQETASSEKVIAVLNDRALGSNDCETVFSDYKTKMGHTAMGRVNTTSSEQSSHAAHMLSLLDYQKLKAALRGNTLGYIPFNKRVKTFRNHGFMKDVYKWGTADSKLPPNTAIPVTKKISTMEKKLRRNMRSKQLVDTNKLKVRSYHAKQ
ncbi:hypothetical protein BCR33DRAFT_725739 [Rhizoclosmatium globosum]|uniref:Uncharacterized protein n=1 Tax=Rhizoclosmatium globosum TaxID=329046 RepID=A0A1Y2AR37_9FUNG|nr:hypothetical protein BCR33DRAFT_727203 [Rhizoclosmatium globosum]ORY27055.1 hypothetical protein BCR33DRAFT_725739 [Rhizoclosmatium globosum]|eukprot:ORY25039.1 hypothetical protein BCR33DRAFT_727203 [Rhizoclosmatium globosum]